MTDVPADPLDCLCAGIVVADHVCEPIADLPAAGVLVETPALTLSIGGCAANCAVNMTRLGLTTAVAGTIGNDILGRFVCEVFDEAQVDRSILDIRDNLDTSATQVINVTGQDRRFIHAPAANAHFTTETISDGMLDRIRVLYLGGYCLTAEPTANRVAELFDRARRRGVITVLDVVIPTPGDYSDRLRDVLPVTDYFVPNDDEAKLLCGLDDPVEQARAFLYSGATNVVITCGDRGSVMLANDIGLWAQAHRVELVDGTGGGDAFTSGLILGLLDNATPGDCLKLGSAAGACCVQVTGATTGMPDAETLRRLAADAAIEIRAV
jgi:sugar/nucleoside kinase (ribokinase family)